MSTLSLNLLLTIITAASPDLDGQRTEPTYPDAQTYIYRDISPDPVSLHIVFPKDWTPQDQRPAFVWFFGGGFVRGTTAQSIGRARWAARQGMVGIAPDYRTRERFGTTADASVADARATLRWLQQHAGELGIDPQNIVVGGGSAGGHLALWTALSTTPPRCSPDEAPLHPPSALILSSPVTDTTPTGGLRGGDRFGGSPEAFSPLHHLDLHMPPVLLIHGDADNIVPHTQAIALAQALAESGNSCHFITVAGGSHSFSQDMPEWRLRALQETEQFLKQHAILPATKSSNP